MKKHYRSHSPSSLALFGSFVFLLYTSSLAPKGVIDHFKVGDVVYSVLDYNQFTQLHGKGWRLMNGAELSISDDLRKLYSSQLAYGKNLPDARGVFIRGMSRGLNSEKAKSFNENGDPEPERTVGSYQHDAFQKHTHEIGIHITYTGQVLAANASTGTYKGNQLTTPSGKEEETRPRNIALYMYIKVQEDTN